ncbi:MAG: mechanosensitive ion channel family protein [Pseudomonas sp.]|nr:MAG: mechanosensitive ion channel family protein [Pseudomonas sp.]
MFAPLELMREKIMGAGQAFFLQLPNIIAAVLLLILVWYASKALASLINRISISRKRPDLGSLLGSLARGALIVFAVLMAAAIVFPTVHPGDIFATLGIGSVAIGFAFKDILQNLLAGLLLLIRRPYKRGDQIIVKGYEGTVEQIESRATLLKTYDGLRVIIPNSDVYTSPVVVNTAYEQHRNELVVGIGYGDNPAAAVKFFRDAVVAVEGVSDEPAVEVIPWGLNDSTVDLKVRWWSGSSRSDQVHVKGRVILAVAKAAKDNGVDLPFPTSVVLFHDQTEEVDGDRTQQREGWPAGTNPPKSRTKMQMQSVRDAATSPSSQKAG